mmetsp:Transcript_7391/g.22513  ORF Transcript_7391/g.22513 Transcript_7391/m.22513 type:complete len:286 (-) Transcript_7391:306-1163(-)
MAGEMNYFQDGSDVGFSFDAADAMGGPDVGGYPDFDLSSVALPELLQDINPNLMGDLREGAPDVLRALMKQEPTQLDVAQPSRTDDFNRSPAFIDDSAGLDQNELFKPMFAYPKTEEVIEGRVASVTSTEGAKPQTFNPGKPTFSNASNTQDASESAGEHNNSSSAANSAGVNRKAIRAERNRQSAAASRERKKHHIRELERRVAMLSMENAQLQVGQLQKINTRIQEEKKLVAENQRLKNQLVFLDMKFNQLTKQMDEAGISDEKRGSRAKTWTPGDFSTRKRN